MTHAKLHIQCTDKQTGEKGDFLTNIETGERVTPIYDSLADFFPWLKKNGWVSQPADSRWPVGHYKKAE